VFLVMNKYLDFMLFILPTPFIIKPWNHHFLGQNSTVIGYWWPYYQIFQLPHCSQVTAHRSPLVAHRSQDSTPLLQVSSSLLRFPSDQLVTWIFLTRILHTFIALTNCKLILDTILSIMIECWSYFWYVCLWWLIVEWTYLTTAEYDIRKMATSSTHPWHQRPHKSPKQRVLPKLSDGVQSVIHPPPRKMRREQARLAGKKTPPTT
jgi:hypothetical protein